MPANNSKILKTFLERLNKYRIFKNTASVLNLASVRAQEIAAEKYNYITKRINDTLIIQDMEKSGLTPMQRRSMPSSISNVWQWYQEITGLDSVEIARQRVVLVQDKLFQCQDDKRILNQQVAALSNALKNIYSELVETRRDDPKFVELVKMENKTLQEDKRVKEQLWLLESEEKDHFTQLTTAIKEYHDTQTMNAIKYKYLSIVASAALTILSLLGSMIYSNRRITKMRKAILQAQARNETILHEEFAKIQTKLSIALHETSQPVIYYNHNTSSYDINKRVVFWSIAGFIACMVLFGRN